MKPCLFISLLLVAALGSCNNQPSEEDIARKVLDDYVCKQTARINNLKILRTEKTASTGKATIFRYTIQGEVEWPGGCTEGGNKTPRGTKETFQRLITLYKAENGGWE